MRVTNHAAAVLVFLSVFVFGSALAAPTQGNAANKCATPYTIINVGGSLGCGVWTVQLTGLGSPNANGISPAILGIYLNGKLVNTTVMYPPSSAKFSARDSSGIHHITINLAQTFNGLPSWAKLAFSGS